ncbi:MAG: IS4 family transposase [Proteobacteria bacterium]|nr:MAG: IS4 family transposase [Pseudomonadota bacterium]
MKNLDEFISEFRPQLKKICSVYDRLWVTRRRKFDSGIMFSAILTQTLDRDSTNYRLIFDRMIESNVSSDLEFSASSYSKARRRMPFEIFSDVSQWVYKFHEVPQNQKWLGLNVFAIDGTRINLPKELEADGFDYSGDDESEFPQAHATVLFDLQKGMIYDSILSQHIDERGSASLLMKGLPDNSLMICDRGFTGFDLLYDAESEGVKILMRMPESSAPEGLQEFIDSDNEDEIITMTQSIDVERKLLRRGYKLRPITVRAIKYYIGQSRFIAITTLLDEEVSKNTLSSMYWCRWDIEECFKIKKEKLKLESFRSKHLLGILQEYWAMQLLYNLGRVFAMCIEGAKSKLKNRVEISLFGVLKILRVHLLKIIYCPKLALDSRILRVERAMRKVRHKFRAGRHYTRNLRSSRHSHH